MSTARKKERERRTDRVDGLDDRTARCRREDRGGEVERGDPLARFEGSVKLVGSKLVGDACGRYC